MKGFAGWGIVGALAVAVVLVSHQTAPSGQSLRVGEAVPPVVTEPLISRADIPSELQGRPLVVFYAALGCAACDTELARWGSRSKSPGADLNGPIEILIARSGATELSAQAGIVHSIADLDGALYQSLQILGTPTVLYISENGILEDRVIGVSSAKRTRLARSRVGGEIE